ncbi:MAG: hypothetical protein GWN73_21445, partial [Actinobacteria bacterium]|nr:hypothetical protein [Actinomycetota bacterium]NIS32863.1 hypothetical protein [Actinomycetota bacterium]NIU67841.1 hypothetical protein [Actinomycetota bacterium]NIW29609.1 hypothetical protein [Actinomycetota bacterium]
SSATGPIWTYRVFDPVIGLLDPPSVDTDGVGNPLPPGAQLTIAGSNFDPPVSVSFGDTLAVGTSLVDDNTIVTTI